MKVTVKAGHLHAVLLTAAKEDIRQYLNTVQFEVQNGTLFMITTDGHRMSYYRQPAPGQPDAIRLVKRDGLITVLKGLKAHEVVELDFEVLTATLPSGAVMSGMLVTEEGRFPAWRRVIPSSVTRHHEESRHMSIGTYYLADLSKAAQHLSQAAQVSRANTMGLRVWTTDKNGSVAATVVGAPAFGYICMAQSVTKAMQEKGIDYTDLPSTQGGAEDTTAGLA